jgi:GNAT superfamily N-acetyltransferase
VTILYAREPGLTIGEFVDVMRRSTLAERRPLDSAERVGRMLRNSNLILTARDGDRLVGVARSVTDYAYCCYLSDLAVDTSYQKRGIGKRLIEETRRAVGPESMVLLLSAPRAMSYYPHIGMPKLDNAFMYNREY